MNSIDPAELRRFTVRRPRAQNTTWDKREWSWLADTAFFDHGPGGKTHAIIFCIENTSRLGFARALPGKSPTAAGVVAVLEELRKTYPVRYLTTDAGREFINGDVEAWAKEHGVTTHKCDPLNWGCTARVERWIGTIRAKLDAYIKLVAGQWDAEALEATVEVYNDTKNRDGFTPNDVARDKQALALIRDMQYKKGAEYRKILDAMAVPGTRVRVWLGSDPARGVKANENWRWHHKGREAWTSQVYEVEKQVGWRVKLKGKERTVAPTELMRVDEEVSAAQRRNADAIAEKLKAEVATKRTVRRLQKEHLHEEAHRVEEDEPVRAPAPRKKPTFATARRRVKKAPRAKTGEYFVEAVLGHRGEGDKFQLKVQYQGLKRPSWQPLANFITEDGYIIAPAYSYITKHKLERESGI